MTTKTGLTTLSAIRFQVDSLDESLAFYKKLGCIVEKVESSYCSISAYVKFNVNDTVMIRLYQNFTHEEKLTAIEKRPVYELAAHAEVGYYHKEISSILATKGIKYLNVQDLNTISMSSQLVDNNNCDGELTQQETEIATTDD